MVNSGRSQEHRAVFLKRLFANGAVYEELLNKLCKAGCDADALSGLLFAVCTVAVADRTERIDLGHLSNPELKRLAKQLNSLADLVDRVNKTSLNPKLDLLSAPPDVNRDLGRKYIARLYDMLPGIMRVYSVHLERFSKFRRAILKRLTFAHLQTLRLLLYIEESTGSPRYEDLSDLLTSGFVVAGGASDNIPDFFSADALAKLKQRTAKFGLTSRF